MSNDPATNTATVTSDERMFAMFSHLSIFFGGLILPLIFWAINKDKSKFVSFHSLQALFFHIAFVFIIVLIIFFIAFGAVGLGVLKAGRQGGSGFLLIFVFAFYGLIFLFAAGAVIYSIFMAIKSYSGGLNKYPIIGNIVYRKVYGAGSN